MGYNCVSRHHLALHSQVVSVSFPSLLTIVLLLKLHGFP